MSIDYSAIRNELASVLREVPGVISVGIGKEGKDVVLVVAIDPDHFAGSIPSSFQGVGVIVRNFGMASLHLFGGRKDNASGSSTVKR